MECAICGEVLKPINKKFGMGGGRSVTKRIGWECRNGCTETTDYYDADQAKKSGEHWSPKEPAHCGVSMINGGSSPVRINDTDGIEYVCQICRHVERIPVP